MTYVNVLMSLIFPHSYYTLLLTKRFTSSVEKKIKEDSKLRF